MIKFLRGKPSLGFSGGSITVRKKETKQEEPLTIVTLGLGTITQFAMRDKVAFIGTAEGATLYNVNTKAKNTYTLADLGVQSIDELDISADEDKAIVRSGTTVYLYAVANGAIDIASKVTLPYAYCNFTDINNRAIAGSGAYPSASGTTKILKFTTGLTYTVAEVLGGSWNHVGKATPQGYGVTLANYWHNNNVNTAYPINSENDTPTCEVLTNLTDMGVSINGTYTVARDGSNYKIYTNIASGAASLTKTATGVGGTAFRFYSDTVIWALSKYSVKVYDFVNEEVLHTIGFGRAINTNFLAACNEKLYTIDINGNLCIIAAIDQAEIPEIEHTVLDYIQSTGTQYIDTGVPLSTTNMKVVVDFQYINTNTEAWCCGTGMEFEAGIYNGTFYTGARFTYSGSDRTSRVTATGINTSTTTNSIYLFGRNMSGDLGLKPMKLYSAKIYDSNGTLIHNYVPAKDSGDTVGLWDTIEKEFLTNIGTGKFLGPPASLAVRYSLPEETVFPGNSTGTMIDTGISQADMANGYCIAMVITPAEWSSYRGIFGYHESTSQGLCGLQCEGDTLNYACFPSSGIRLNVSTVPINTKQQIVINYDPATGLTTIYRNGVALGSATMGGPTAFGNIIIGRAFVGDNRYYKGIISSFDIYNREATAEELATIFSSFTPESAT